MKIYLGLEKDTYKVVRQNIIDMILATEMTKHFEHLAKFVSVCNKPSALDDAPVDGLVSIDYIGEFAQVVIKHCIRIIYKRTIYQTPKFVNNIYSDFVKVRFAKCIICKVNIIFLEKKIYHGQWDIFRKVEIVFIKKKSILFIIFFNYCPFLLLAKTISTLDFQMTTYGLSYQSSYHVFFFFLIP